MKILKSLFGSREQVNPQEEKAEKFLEFFDFKPEAALLKEVHFQAEILWRLVLMARELKKSAEDKVTNPHSYSMAYRYKHSEYCEAILLVREFCPNMSDIPSHWAALNNYIEGKRDRGMRGHRVFTETLVLD